jgi:hypothetical protein
MMKRGYYFIALLICTAVNIGIELLFPAKNEFMAYEAGVLAAIGSLWIWQK